MKQAFTKLTILALSLVTFAGAPAATLMIAPHAAAAPSSGPVGHEYEVVTYTRTNIETGEKHQWTFYHNTLTGDWIFLGGEIWRPDGSIVHVYPDGSTAGVVQ